MAHHTGSTSRPDTISLRDLGNEETLLLMMRNGLPLLEGRSYPAALAATRFFMSCQPTSPDTTRVWAHAGDRYSTLLAMYHPDDASLAAAREHYQQALSLGQQGFQPDPRDQLTPGLTLLEQAYVCLIKGQRTEFTFEEITTELTNIVAGFMEEGNWGRQARARFILADLLRQNGRVDQAKQQLAAAMRCLGQGLDENTELARLAAMIDSPYAEEVTNNTTQAGQTGRHHQAAHATVGAGTGTGHRDPRSRQ